MIDMDPLHCNICFHNFQEHVMLTENLDKSVCDGGAFVLRCAATGPAKLKFVQIMVYQLFFGMSPPFLDIEHMATPEHLHMFIYLFMLSLLRVTNFSD